MKSSVRNWLVHILIVRYSLLEVLQGLIIHEFSEIMLGSSKRTKQRDTYFLLNPSLITHAAQIARKQVSTCQLVPGKSKTHTFFKRLLPYLFGAYSLIVWRVHHLVGAILFQDGAVITYALDEHVLEPTMKFLYLQQEPISGERFPHSITVT